VKNNNSTLHTDASRPVTALLVAACPFLNDLPQIDWDCGDTIALGDVSRWLTDGTLSENQITEVFEAFNTLATSDDSNTIEVLATGALETLNDDAARQRLARKHLNGRALDLLEEMRIGWGQPAYGNGG
jgi:hypothetical protein